MKNFMLTGLITTTMLCSGLANASCSDIYRERLEELEWRTFNGNTTLQKFLSDTEEANVALMAMSVSTTLGGNGMLALALPSYSSTTATVDSAKKEYRDTMNVYRLLKESDAGVGSSLEQFIDKLNEDQDQEVNRDEVIAKINELNERESFCDGTSETMTFLDMVYLVEKSL